VFCSLLSAGVCYLLWLHNLSCIVSPAEILLGVVYIWGNPQLCFPDPQSIDWRDTLDEHNDHARRHRLQPRASECEQLVDNVFKHVLNNTNFLVLVSMDTFIHFHDIGNPLIAQYVDLWLNTKDAPIPILNRYSNSWIRYRWQWGRSISFYILYTLCNGILIIV